MALDRIADPAAVILDEIHDEKTSIGIVHAGDGKVRKPRELTEHVCLKLEARAAAAIVCASLDRQAALVGEPYREAREAEAHGERPGLDDRRAECGFEPVLQRWCHSE
ncbi:MAG: hypothetical protein ACREDO_08265 [Methyloceanibacter sp.]